MKQIDRYKQALENLSCPHCGSDVNGNNWKQAARELAEVLERTKKLTMGPSFELQDSIMVDVFKALAAHAALLKEGRE